MPAGTYKLRIASEDDPRYQDTSDPFTIENGSADGGPVWSIQPWRPCSRQCGSEGAWGDVPVGERECNRFECPDLPLVLTSPAPHDRVLSDDTFNITWNGGQMYGQVQLAIKRVDGSAALRSAASIRMATGAIKVIYARICHLTKSCFDLASDL
eukprot:scaffold5810_cov17-Tisochrysis_lutea.AAC.1